MNGLALCAGIGGLDLGAERLFGHRVVCHVEREAYAAAVLVARMADGSIPEAPVWDDLATFDGRAWRGVVDIVSAGFPCQPASVAGKRRGTDDERWIFGLIAKIIDDVRPSLVLLENVPGLLTVSSGDGFREVLGTLAALGFDAEWCCVRASDVGAPHRRERWFCLAHRDGSRLGAPITEDGWPETPRIDLSHVGCRCDDALESLAITRRGDSPGACAGGSQLGHAHGTRRTPPRDGHEVHARLQPERASWPPGPSDTDGWAAYLERWPGLEPAIRGGTSRLPHRMDRLRALGNAVVPDQAERAVMELTS